MYKDIFLQKIHARAESFNMINRVQNMAVFAEQCSFWIMLHFFHDDVIKWKHFPCNWPFVRGIDLFPVNSTHKGQWRRALMFSLIYVWINDWVNNREAGDLRRYRAHYDVIVMSLSNFISFYFKLIFQTHYQYMVKDSYLFLSIGISLKK